MNQEEGEYMSHVPRVHVLQNFLGTDGEITGQITSQVGADGVWIQFDCECTDALPTCKAACCALRGTYLTPEEASLDFYDCFVEEESGLPVLRRDADGWCTYLDRDTRRCSIYENRPQTCQKFHCTRGANVRGWKLSNAVHRHSIS